MTTEAQPELFKLFEEEPGGVRPEAFAEPRPQEREQRHTMEQLADVAPMVPLLYLSRRWWTSWWP